MRRRRDPAAVADGQPAGPRRDGGRGRTWAWRVGARRRTAATAGRGGCIVTSAKRLQPINAKAVRGSDAARRSAALLLEAWSGVRSTTSASEAMGVALTRFYQLEARALQLLVS